MRVALYQPYLRCNSTHCWSVGPSSCSWVKVICWDCIFVPGVPSWSKFCGLQYSLIDAIPSPHQNYLLTLRKTESSKRITDLFRSWWLLVVDESVSSDDESFFCSMIVSFLALSMLVFSVECLIGLTRAWISGLSGDSSANGIFSPKVSGRLSGLWMWEILLVTDMRGFDSWLWLVPMLCCFSSLSDESTDEFRSDRNLLSNIAVRDERPAWERRNH